MKILLIGCRMAHILYALRYVTVIQRSQVTYLCLSCAHHSSGLRLSNLMLGLV